MKSDTPSRSEKSFNAFDDATASRTARIAFLTGEYPKVSHTFIQREIAALRALGLDVSPCTVRRAPAKDVIGADQAAEAAATYCILDAAKSPRHLVTAHGSALIRAPGRWFEAVGIALRMRSPGVRALLYQLFYFAEAGVLAAHMRRQGITHLHNHFGDSSCTVAMLASVMSGIPFSFTEHGPALFFAPEKWRIDLKIARAARVVAISHFCRSQLMLFSDPMHWPKIAIVHCGVDSARYGTKPREGFGKHVLFVGRLDPVKGVPLLLEAFAQAAAAHPDARLTIVGDGAGRKGLEAQAATPDLSGRVDFAGYRSQDEVARLLEVADMLVLPSFAEGVPVVLMEAMASRIPVIASQVGGVSELVRDGETGFLVPPGDVATLAERLGRLLSDPEMCRRMGLAGRAVVEAEFDVAREAAWLAQVLRGEAEPGRLRPEQSPA